MIGATGRGFRAFSHITYGCDAACRPGDDILAWPPLRQEEKWGRQNVSVSVGLEQITFMLPEQL